MSLWILLVAVGALALAIGYLAFLGAKSPLRVLFIPPTAWRLALNCWRSNPRLLATIASLIAFSAGLQLYFVNTSGHDPQVLLITSIAFQALMAALTAALAVPLHLYVIHDYWRAPVSFPPEGRHLLDYAPLRAAGFGLAIWTFDYLVSVGARMVVQSIGDPDLQQLAYWSFASASFLLTSLLALVRPALSLGLPHPFRAGIRMAGGNALALYLLLAAMAVPAILLRPEAELLPRIYMRSVLVADVVSIALILPLNVFQYLAVEISTVLFAVAAFLRGRDEASRKAAELRLLNRLFPAAS